MLKKKEAIVLSYQTYVFVYNIYVASYASVEELDQLFHNKWV